MLIAALLFAIVLLLLVLLSRKAKVSDAYIDRMQYIYRFNSMAELVDTLFMYDSDKQLFVCLFPQGIYGDRLEEEIRRIAKGDPPLETSS